MQAKKGGIAMEENSPPPQGFDVFISFAGADMELAEILAEVLERANYRPYFYPERNLRSDVTNYNQDVPYGLNNSKVVVCIVSQDSFNSLNVYKELTYATNRRLSIIPLIMNSKIEISDDYKYLLGSDLYINIDGGITQKTPIILGRVKTAIEKYEGRCAEEAESPDSELLGSDLNFEPYPGPTPFETKMEDLFFGRDQDSSDLITLLKSVRIVVLHAPSGAGKSSMLNAKVIPELSRTVPKTQVIPKGTSDALRVSRMIPDLSDEDRNLNVFTYSVLLGIADGLKVENPDKSATLASYLRDSVKRGDGEKERVIVLDQFEEIFTHYTERYRQRKGFIHGLVEALDSDPTLRVVLSLRKEYLADIEDLLKVVPEEFAVAKFPLGRMDSERARHAITKPVEKYIRFESGENGALNILIEQLLQKGEFIEMAHLQIVCKRLWESLPKKTKVVRKKHLEEAIVGNSEQAAGLEKKHEDFVADALNQFYSAAVAEVAQDLGMESDLIFFGCSKFISTQATRLTLPSQHGRTGRLANKVVDKLVDHRLLRRESRGPEHWYELSHDLLAQAVASHRGPKTTELLLATDLLDSTREKVALEHDGNLEGYFGEHNDLLNDCRPLASHESLFKEELELLFRASIASGIDSPAWYGRIGQDFPEERVKILCEALDSITVKVRRNAVRVICDQPDDCPLPESHKVLFKERLELLFMESIESGVDTFDWCRRIGNNFPKDRLKVLCGALESTSEKVRRNAVHVICDQPVENLMNSEVELATTDQDESVRKTVSSVLSRVDREELYKKIAKSLDDSNDVETRERAIETLSMIRMRSVGSEVETKFPEFFEKLKSPQERAIRRRTWWLRARVAQPLFVAVPIFAAGFACLAAGAFKTIPGHFNWALAQHVSNAIVSFFQGGIGGVVWGGSISLGVTLYYGVFGSANKKSSTLKPAGALVFGTLSGLIFGLLIATVMVVGVLNINSLWRMGWITQGTDNANVFRDAFLITRFGWLFPIEGMGLGLGIALMANAIRTTEAWEALLHSDESHIQSAGALWKVLRRIFRICVPKFWLLISALAVAGLLAFFVPDATFFNDDPLTKANHAALIKGLIGDCLTEAVGGLGAVAGMMLAAIIIRNGISIEPSRDRG